MSEQMIIDHCSPTLAGLKTANLFSCRYECQKTLWEEIRRFNRTLSHKGIIMLPIRVCDCSALIYLYRPRKLEIDISNETGAQMLRQYGYDCINPNHCITELIRRFQMDVEFPHEIGLFLGYPPEDVKCFIEHKGKGSKCVGCWKVYCDEENAKKCFETYKKCTNIYQEQYAKGKSIELLTIADYDKS